MFIPSWEAILIVAFLAAVFLGRRTLRSRAARKQVPALLRAGAVVIDVRSPGEFAVGSRKGSINIPLDQLQTHLPKLDRAKPIVLCCASGTRSAMAASLLKRAGFSQVVNAGVWSALPE